MYAYVRYLEDNVTRSIHVDKIKNFDPEDIKMHDKKYKVLWDEDGEYYPASIIYVRDTLEDLERVITRKRVVFPNKDLLISDYCESSDSERDVIGKLDSTKPQAKPRKFKTLEGTKALQEEILQDFKKGPKQVIPLVIPEKKNLDTRNIDPTDHNPDSYQVEELKKEILTLKNKIADKEEIIEQLTKLNMELQRDVINVNKELIKNFNDKPAHINKTLEVGVEVGDEIHLGQNIFLNKNSYDSAKVTARTGAQFVKNLAMSLFGATVLKKSSCTGKLSNNHKKDETKPALDPTKVRAIYDMYGFYLKNDEKMSDKEIQRELKQINSYIASKISDLNRGKRQKLKGEKELGPAHEEESDIQRDTNNETEDEIE